MKRYGLAALVGALFLCGCSKNADVEARNPGTPGGSAQADVPTVAVAEVKTEDLSRTLVLTAEFKPYQEIDLMAKVAGYIKQINVDIGDRVSQGQLLATLEIPEQQDELTRAKASVERSQAGVRQAQDELERAKSARDFAHVSYTRLQAVSEKRPNLVAQQEIDDAHSKDLVAQSQVSAAESALAAAKEQVGVNQADVQKANTMIDYTRVTAPFAGVITKRYADTGSMIQAGTASQTQAMPVVRLSQNSLLRLILPVPESAVPTIHIGQLVEVRVPTLNRSFPGRVVRFEGKLSLETRTMNTEVDVENPSLLIMPGMYAEVDLTLAQRNKVLTIPVTAIDLSAGSEGQSSGTAAGSNALANVMVVTPNNRVEVRQIQLGLETSNRAEVRSGLNEGDLVVVGGRSGLQPGQAVKPKVTSMTSAPAAQ